MRFKVYGNEESTKTIVNELREKMKDTEPGEEINGGISSCCLPVHKKICKSRKFECDYGCRAYYITVEEIKKN